MPQELLKTSMSVPGPYEMGDRVAAYKKIKASGIDGIDLGLYEYWWPDQEPAGLLFGDEASFISEMRSIREAADEAGLEIAQTHATFGAVAPNAHENENYMHAIRRCIQATSILGSRYIVVHPVYVFSTWNGSKAEEWEWNRAFYGALIPTLQEYDVVCCLENMFSCYGNVNVKGACGEPAEAVRYIEQLNAMAGEDGRFAFCLDTGHAMLTGVDLLQAVRTLGKHIACLHIQDNDGRSDLHRFPYAGNGDWARFLKGLVEIGYEGYLNFEAWGPFPDELREDAMRFLGAIGRHFAKVIADGQGADALGMI